MALGRGRRGYWRVETIASRRVFIKLRKQDKDERDERDTLLDMYMRAMETAGPELAAKAA